MTWEKSAKSRHLQARAAVAEGVYLEQRTIDTGITLGYAAATLLSAGATPRWCTGTTTSSRCSGSS